MSFFAPIDHIFRRSSSFIHPKTYEEFMDYACHCRDELEVYLHMEENRIGIDQPMFWLTLFQTLKERCQLKLLVKKLTQIKQNTHLTEKPDYLQIVSFEENLIRELKIAISRRKTTTKRTVREFNMFSVSNIFKSKRKIGDGSFQIYVDQENRKKYHLNDIAEFVLEEMKDYVDAKIKAYEQKRTNRPWSFLGENEDGLSIWSRELIQANQRNSQIISFSELTNNRLSNQQRTGDKRVSAMMGRKSNMLNNQNPENDLQKTPRDHRKNQIEREMNEQTIGKLIASVKKQTSGDVFTTPPNKTPTITKSIMKARAKNQRRDEENEESEIEELQRQLKSLSQPTDVEIDMMIYPEYLEVIRRESNEEEKLIQARELLENSYSETKNSVLDIARIENSSFDLSGDSNSQRQVLTVLNCLKSTHTLESLDSNDQNVFSNQKAFPISEQLQNFRNFRRVGRGIFTNDPHEASNSSPSNSDLSISEIQQVQTDPSDILSYQDFLDIDDEMHRCNLNENKNLVLETMRKKKIDEIKESEKRREALCSHNGIYTEMKPLSRLTHISEEHSYNSERRYTSRERFSSGIYKDEETEKEKEDKEMN